MNSWAKSDSFFGLVDFSCADDYYEKLVDISHDYMINIEGLSDNQYDNLVSDKITALDEEATKASVSSEHMTEVKVIGPNDMNLAKRLIAAGGEHRKFLRQIFVSVDITAPLYWWKEADTYKVGTTANSTSTMHKLASTPITRECFEMDDYDDIPIETVYYGETDEVAFDYHTNDFIDEFCETLEQLRQKYNETKDKRYWKELIRWLPESWLQTRTVTMNYENLRNMYHQRKGHKLTEWHSFCEWVESLPYAKELIID
jgi:hypothetical protein